MGDVERLLVLVPWLLERPGASVAEAAAAVGASQREVLAALDALQYCGLPGRLGGDLFEVELTGERILLRLAPAFDRPLRPTPTEALELVLALDTVAAALGDAVPGLTEAVARLRRAAGVPAGVVATPGDGGAWLPALRRAVADGASVRLLHRGRGAVAPRERHVEPWELLHHTGAWYLHAHDRDEGALRTFRLDRVEDVTVDPAPAAEPRPPGALPPPSYEPGSDDVRVQLAVAPGGRWLLGALGHVETVAEHPDGTVDVIVPTDAPGWIADHVLAAGGAVRVIGPDDVRAAVTQRATTGLERHGNG